MAVSVLSVDGPKLEVLHPVVKLLSANNYNPSVRKAKPVHLLIVLLLALTWGSSFILMKRGLKDEMNLPVLSPGQVAALRMGIASLVLLPVSIRAIPKLKKADWKWLLIVGILGSGIPAFIFAYGGLFLHSSVAGILNSLTPLFTLIVGIAIFRKAITNWQVIGVVVGLVGAVTLIALQGFGSSANWTYSLLIALATFFYGISVNTISSKLAHIPAIWITSISLLIVGVPYLVYLATTDIVQVVTENPHGWDSLGYVCLLGIFGSAMANALFFKLTQETSPIFAASVTYLMPLVAVGWGLADGEGLTIYHLLAALLILAGVWMVNRK
jgi:drug/metabolite transporter (DMT)-like permease